MEKKFKSFEENENVKNILISFASHEANQVSFIDDISKLDITDDTQKNIKEAILWSLNPDKRFKKFDWIECDRTYGMLDNRGYEILNTIYDVYGPLKPPFTVEHITAVRCVI